MSKQESGVSVSAPARQKQKGCRDKASRSIPLKGGVLRGPGAAQPWGKDGSSPRVSPGWLKMSHFAVRASAGTWGMQSPSSGELRRHLCFGTQRGTSVAGGELLRSAHRRGDTALAGAGCGHPDCPPDCPPHSQIFPSRAPTEHRHSPTEVCSVTCAAGGWAQQGNPHPMVSHGRDGAGIKPAVLSAFSTPFSRAQPGTSQGAAPCTSSGTAEAALGDPGTDGNGAGR